MKPRDREMNGRKKCGRKKMQKKRDNAQPWEVCGETPIQGVVGDSQDVKSSWTKSQKRHKTLTYPGHNPDRKSVLNRRQCQKSVSVF